MPQPLAAALRGGGLQPLAASAHRDFNDLPGGIRLGQRLLQAGAIPPSSSCSRGTEGSEAAAAVSGDGKRGRSSSSGSGGRRLSAIAAPSVCTAHVHIPVFWLTSQGLSPQLVHRHVAKCTCTCSSCYPNC